jgi:curli biogenesis system outer membrane secretion channel CsgG
MNNSTKVLLSVVVASLFLSGCAQKVQIKALKPAEVGEMASKKKVAISEFKNDKVGLSGKIESALARHKIDKKKYFTVLSRKDMAKVIAEQSLQSSELMDEATSAKVGKLIGAQAIINGEVSSANAESGSYMENRKECLKYYKDGGCAYYRYYKVKCNTTQASVAANINIVNVETGSIIYGDTISKDYSADSCKAGKKNLGLLLLNTGPKQILSKGQALNKLASDIAKEFVYKLTPNYIYFNVTLLDKIDVEPITEAQEKKFENALKYIKASRYDKSKKLLSSLMDELNAKSYVVAYDYGIIQEATGNYEEAKKLYSLADDLTVEPVKEINIAMNRITNLIEQEKEAKKQMNAK